MLKNYWENRDCPSFSKGKRGLSLVVLIVLFLFPQYLYAISSTTGTTAAAFLKIPAGARPSGMGETFVAIGDDVNAVYWNPAGLGTLDRAEVTAMHSIWFSDIKYDFLAFAYPTSIGTFGINATLVSMGTFEGYTIDSQNNPVATGYYTARDLSIGASFAYEVDTNIYIGGTLKYINEIIDDMSAYGFALDTGFLYKDIIENVSIGLNIQNIGPAMKYKNVSSRMPLNFKIGVSAKPVRIFTYAIDFDIPTDNKLKLNTGIELWIQNLVAIRVGYSFRFGDFEYSTRLAGLSSGIGFKISNDYFLDYVFVPYGNLGNTHRFAISVKL